MADEIKKTITADTTQANREFVKLSNEVDRLKQKLKETHKSSEEGSSKMVEALKEQTSFITKSATEMLTLKFVVDQVSEAFKAHREAVKAAGEAHEGFLQRQQKVIAFAGSQVNREREEAFIRSAPTTMGLTREQALTMFSAGSDARLDSTINKALMREIAPLAATAGTDKDTLGQLQKTAGGLINAAGLSPNDAADVALKLLQDAGKDAPSLADQGFLQSVRSLKEGGMSASKILGITSAYLDTDQKIKGAQQLAGVLTQKFDIPAEVRGKEYAESDRLRAKMNAMNPDERLAFMQMNPAAAEAAMGHEGALRFGELGGRIGTREAEITRAMQTDYARGEAGLASPEMVKLQQRLVRGDLLAMKQEPRGLEVIEAEDELKRWRQGKTPLQRKFGQAAGDFAITYGEAGPGEALMAAEAGGRTADSGTKAIGLLGVIADGITAMKGLLANVKPAARAAAAHRNHNE